MAHLKVKLLEATETRHKIGTRTTAHKQRNAENLRFKPGETLATIFARAKNKQLGKYGVLQLRDGSRVGTDYTPTDGDVLEQFIPYCF